MYYGKRLKEMPLKVLSKHDIIKREGNLVSLNVKKLTFEQKSQIKMLCEKALREFIVKKGIGIWDYRLLDTDPISYPLCGGFVVSKEQFEVVGPHQPTPPPKDTRNRRRD